MLVTLRDRVQSVLRSPSAGGVVLGLAAIAALLLCNSPWSEAYQRFIQLPVEFNVGRGMLVLAKPLLVWVNDLWMAVFFFLVGLEIKRELLVGELATRRQALLPAVAALGGMLVPVLVYAVINRGDVVALRGVAIPAATDIAFALGILLLLGSRVPAALKVFLTAVAIIDDLGAIVIIALFYTSALSLTMLLAATVPLLLLLLLNRARVMVVAPYVLVGLLLWLCVLKSGIHATLAGVITALAVPMRDADGHSPLAAAEHALQPWVAFLVLPMFAFANAGLDLSGLAFATLREPVTLGIVAGLVLGKTVGVFTASWLMIRFAGATLPTGSSWQQFFGVCVLCGVGFTMSLFIGTLAFAGEDPRFETLVKLGVLAGSLLAGTLGTLVLWRSRPPALLR